MMLKAIVAGLISGLVSPLILAWIQHRVLWTRQKKAELRYSVFQDAVLALSKYYTDALDPQVQSNKASFAGMSRPVEARPDTWVLLEKSKSMVQAFFSKDAHESFDKACKTSVSIAAIPNWQFEEARVAAIIKMASELGLK
jgi:hypothetical protein